MGTALGLIMVVAAVAVVLLPLLRRPGEEAAAPAEDPELQELLSRRESTFSALRELDADHDMGNLSEQDYRELRQRYQEQAVSLIKGLDDLEKARLGGDETELSTGIEEEVQAFRRIPSTMACPRCQAKVGPEDMFCARCGANLKLTCPDCGSSLEVEAQFCSRCGVRLPTK